MLRFHTDILGKLVLAEDEPDLSTTAYGVIADLLELGGLQGAEQAAPSSNS
jgi:hypothetical protein